MYSNTIMTSPDTLILFDEYLKKQLLCFEGILIGGVALLFLKVSMRRTGDVDILYPEIPEDIKSAARVFAEKSLSPIPLAEDWFNNGPMALTKNLPLGWEQRSELAFKGRALKLFILCRSDLLLTKLFAYCDRDIDLEDCIALNPVKEELIKAFSWVSTQDANKRWPDRVVDQFIELSKRLGYELSKTDLS